MTDEQMSFQFDDAKGTGRYQAEVGTDPDDSRPGAQEKLPPDQAQRMTIRGELDRNVMVLAGAGAGKTHELVERALALIRNGKVDIRELAAITFTRKAAGELRSRIYERLQEDLKAKPDEVLRRAVERIDQCFIGTIHAFCSRLLRERPLEAGLPFDFKELDERDEPRARRRAWVAYRNERLREGDERLTRLLEINFDSAKLFDFFTRRCQFPELELKPTTAEEPDLGSAVEAVRAFVDEAYDHWTPELDDNPDELADIITAAADFEATRGVETEHDRFAYLSFFDKSKINPTQKRWANDGWAKRAKHELLPILLVEVVHPALRSWKQYVYTLIVDIVNGAKDFYDNERRQAGAVTFEDLLIRTAEMLRYNPEVRSYFGRRYRTILVDEFQDTDPVQAEVLMYLTSTDPTQKDWKQAVPRPGSLFVVGDEKQSIYRFRRADVETFRFIRDRIDVTGGEIVRLNTSFRSLGRLCDRINRSFEPIFSKDGEKYQSQYGQLLRHRPEGFDDFCVRAIRHPKPPKGVDLAVLDAARISDFIKAAFEGQADPERGEDGYLIEEPVSYGHFMILTRTKRHLNTYAKALEERGIPYDMVGGGELGKSEEVIAITELLEAVADPNNPIPLVSYLRGRLVGLGDDELFAVRQEGFRFDYRLDEYGEMGEALRLRLSAAYERLRSAREALTGMTPLAAFSQILDELGIIPWASADEDRTGSSRAGGLIRLLANVRRWERMGLTWVEIVDEMRAMIEGDFDIPGITLESGDPEAVQLMNLHQAKGLQANIVFLAAPYDATSESHPPDFHVSRFNGTPYLSIPVNEKKQNQRYRSWKTLAEPEGWAEDSEEEKKFLAAEENRLRYVAATRARNLLVISTVERQRRGPWCVLAGFLGDVPDLETSPAASLPAPDDGTTSLELLAAEDEEWRSMLEPSWTALTAAVDEEHMVFVTGERRGADFGTMVHQALDDVIAGRVDDVESYLNTLGREHGMNEKAVEASIDAVNGFLKSDIYEEMRTAEEVHGEVPFGVYEDGSDPTMTTGRIDLVYKNSRGWKIVDYKTDAATTDLEVNHLIDRYRDQVALYADHWSRITGESVVEKGLWLTAMNRYVPVD